MCAILFFASQYVNSNAVKTAFLSAEIPSSRLYSFLMQVSSAPAGLPCCAASISSVSWQYLSGDIYLESRSKLCICSVGLKLCAVCTVCKTSLIGLPSVPTRETLLPIHFCSHKSYDVCLSISFAVAVLPNLNLPILESVSKKDFRLVSRLYLFFQQKSWWWRFDFFFLSPCFHSEKPWSNMMWLCLPRAFVAITMDIMWLVLYQKMWPGEELSKMVISRRKILLFWAYFIGFFNRTF